MITRRGTPAGIAVRGSNTLRASDAGRAPVLEALTDGNLTGLWLPTTTFFSLCLALPSFFLSFSET